MMVDQLVIVVALAAVVGVVGDPGLGRIPHQYRHQIPTLLLSLSPNPNPYLNQKKSVAISIL